MLFTQSPKTISERIIFHILSNGATRTTDLLNAFKRSNEPISGAGFYKALGELLGDEVLVKTGKNLSISRLWADRAVNVLANSASLGRQRESLIGNLSDGQSVRHEFTSIDAADAYWGHLFFDCMDLMDKKTPLVLLNQHQFSMLIRRQAEEHVWSAVEGRGFLTLVSLAHGTPQDKRVQKNYQSSLTKINTGMPYSFPNNIYINILGDFIIEGAFEQGEHARINDWYTNHQSNEFPNEKELATLSELFSQLSHIRLRITRNAKKAAVLRKKMSRDFYIPSEFSA